MKLFIDDIRNAPDDSWVTARTITEAIRILATMHVDEVSIDHDISHQVIIGETERPYPCGEMFEAVAWYIKAMPKTSSPSRITIHTSNPVGRQKIIDILHEKYGGNLTVIKLGPANRLEMII